MVSFYSSDGEDDGFYKKLARSGTTYNVQPARSQDSTLYTSGINLIHQLTIAVERFAVLDFHRSLPNARLQSGGLDIVLFAGGLPIVGC